MGYSEKVPDANAKGILIKFRGIAASSRRLRAAFHRSTAPGRRIGTIIGGAGIYVAETVYSSYGYVSGGDDTLESDGKVPDLHDGQQDSESQFTSVQPPRYANPAPPKQKPVLVQPSPSAQHAL